MQLLARALRLSPAPSLDSPVLRPRPIARAARRSQPMPMILIVYGIACVSALGYAIFFSWLSIQRYDAFLMHALDMGNMDQAVWHTLHGQFLYFTNMRTTLPKEAWGTTTRLSFHVEPILLPLSLLYLLHAGPETLIVAQATIVALGAPAAARLALRVTDSALFALVAALAYLLSPTVQAATLYEFHAVTLVAALLLWAIVFAEERRYTPFVACCALAIACKEEIGLVVAMLCLWLWWRGSRQRLLVVTGVLAACWSLIAVGLIVPYFAHGASAYWQRYINAGAADSRTSSGFLGVLSYWFHHPDKPVLTVLWWPKWAMLQRWLVTMGYLGIAGLPMLLVSLPSLAIILLSTDQHMYGGLGQYSAELVPIGVAAGIYGVGWLMRQAARHGWETRWVPGVCALWILVLAGWNARLNGFTPLTTGYAAPAITAHDLLGDQLLRLIPPSASVSAMDQLDPHLGDRPTTYLFPDVGDARSGYTQYVALDVTTNASPGTADDPLQVTIPADQHRAAMALLDSRRYRILAADDGYLILQRTPTALWRVPVLPQSFFTFMRGSGGTALHPIARFGDALELVGVQIERREQVNLRVPDAILTTTWRVLRPLPPDLRLHVLVTDTGGRIKNDFTDFAAMDWLPPDRWHVGQTIRIRSQQISIVDLDPGSVALRVRLDRAGESGQDQPFTPRLIGHEHASATKIVAGAVEVARLRVVF